MGLETKLNPQVAPIFSKMRQLATEWQLSWKQVKPIGFEAPRGGAYNNQKHLKLETPCSYSAKLRQ